MIARQAVQRGTTIRSNRPLVVKTRAVMSSEREAQSTTSEPFKNFLSSNPRIILGSASLSRRKIMDDLTAQYGFDYEVQTAGIDEKAIRFDCPEQLVIALGLAKADAITGKLQNLKNGNGEGMDGYLLTCDQVVVHEGEILEKPESEEEARAYVKRYANSPVRTVGSVVCTHLLTGVTHETIEKTFVEIAPIPESSITAMIEEGGVYNCAGGLMIEHPLVTPHITKIVGSEDAVMGLSKAAVIDSLLRMWREIEGSELN